MKTEWLVVSVTPVGCPDRAEHDILGRFWVFFVTNSGHVCGRRATLWRKNPLLSPNNFTESRLIKIEWLVTNVTPFWSPDRAEHDSLGMLLDVFWPNHATFLGREPLCDVGILSWALRTLLRAIKWKQSGWLAMYYLTGPLTEQKAIFWMLLGICWPIQATFVVREPLCDVEILFWALITLLRAIY